MGRELYREFPQARMVFEEVEDTLKVPLKALCFEGPEAALTSTETSQPAILCLSVACHRVLDLERPVQPSYLCGHSLGEYSALVAAGAMGVADAAKIVRRRGELMQAAVPAGEGGMAAVMGLDRAQVERICEESSHGEVLVPANYNAPGQTVISGKKAALQRAKVLVKDGGGRFVPLPVSGPFHSPLMEPAADGLERALAFLNLQSFAPGVVTNVEAEANTRVDRVKDLLIRQVTKPVYWEESVRWMIGRGIRFFIELGPGRVLCNLIQRIDRSVKTKSLERPEDLRLIL
jgi:[acyl-carrier-protein] S-malonyltransferase